MKTLLFVSVALLCLAGCRKEAETIKIDGVLLESSSHPVPVTDYTLSFCQDGGGGVVGSSSSSSSDCITDENGYFQTHFQLGKASLLVFSGSNSSRLTVSGEKNAGTKIYWFFLKPVPQTLTDIFLYKKVSTAFVEIKTDTALSPTDTIEVSSETTTGNYHKMVTGKSIPAATFTTIDTIFNKISTYYSFDNKFYNGNILVSIKKNGRTRTASVDLESGGDEETKTYQLIFQ